jgi:hypothetical protein
MQIFFNIFGRIITVDVSSSDIMEDVEKALCKAAGYEPPREDDPRNLLFGNQLIYGRASGTANVGQSIHPIHLLHKFFIHSDLVVVDSSSRSEGEACHVNLYVPT